MSQIFAFELPLSNQLEREFVGKNNIIKQTPLLDKEIVLLQKQIRCCRL